MSNYKDREQLDALRQRLYERNQEGVAPSPRHGLSRTGAVDVARGWGESFSSRAAAPAPAPAPQPVQVMPEVAPVSVARPPLQEALREEAALVVDAPKHRRRSYRTYILLSSLAAFVVTVTVASLYLFFGGNQISGKNISIALSAPIAVAGGDILELQVGINNMNSVAIEGATLIVNYPPGTKAADESARDLLQDRIPLENIAAGETRTVPLRAAVFGEENEEKEVSAVIEYRVAGSNSVFVKDAEPIKFTINTSPVVLRVESVQKISSGQEFDITLTVQSNAEAPLRNVLVSAAYPESFTFIRSKPEPVYRQNEWKIDDLAAKGVQKITIRGSASGLSDEEFMLRFQAGTPRNDNQFIIGSILAQTSYVLTVERPFVDMEIDVNGDTDNDVVLESGSLTNIVITVTNTRPEAVYDMRLQLIPTGSGFREDLLSVENGFYNSIEKDVRFETSGMPDLSKVLPGEQRRFYVRLGANKELRTASLGLKANVYARRVNESGVAEELIGASEATIKYSSVASLARQLDLVSGPVPPVVNQQTVYKLTLAAEAGTNDLTGAVVTATLPQHVEWRNVVTGSGDVEYNPINKQIRWTVGEIKGRERKTMSAEVGLTPGLLQVGSTPVIMNAQELRATDRFTGAPLTAEAPPITTELSEEAGFDRGNGEVQAAAGGSSE